MVDPSCGVDFVCDLCPAWNVNFGIILILFDENEESNEYVVSPEISEENKPRGYRQNIVVDSFDFQVKLFFFYLNCFCFEK